MLAEAWQWNLGSLACEREDRIVTYLISDELKNSNLLLHSEFHAFKGVILPLLNFLYQQNHVILHYCIPKGDWVRLSTPNKYVDH